MRNILLVLVGLVLCGAAAWLLLDDSPAPDDGPLTALSPGDDTSVAATNPALRERPAVADLLPIVPEVPELEPELPASYRAALGGLKGRVIEEDGTPVPGLSVALVGSDFFGLMKPLDVLVDDPALEFDPLLAEMVTDDEGRFFAGELETRVVGGLIADPGGPRASVHVLDHSPETGVVHDLGDIVLAGGVTLRGRVVDERNEPLAGVRVRSLPLALPPAMFPEEIIDLSADGGLLIDTGNTDMGAITYLPPKALGRLERLLPLPTTTTDAKGEWELVGVPSGTPTLLFDDGLHVSRARSPGPTGPPGSEVDMDDVMLFDGVTLRGRVVDAQGEPVPDAEVLAGNRLALGPPVAILRAPVFADADGRFEVPGLRPHQAHAVARQHEGDEFTASEAVTAGEEDAVVRLQTGRRLDLLVLGIDGEPITNAEITGRALPDDDADEVPEFIFPTRSLQRQVRVDSETKHTLVSDLSASYWDLTVRAEGYAVSRSMHDLRKADLNTTLQLQPELSARVRVVRASDGEPVEHAMVAVGDSNSRSFSGERPLTTRRTDADGWAELGGLTAGEVVFTVSHPALAVVEVESSVPQEEALVIELPEGGRILGQLFEAGEAPREPMMIILSSRGSADVAQAPRFGVSDFEGRFSFSNVQPGKANIEVRERIGSLNLASPIDNFFVSELAKAEVEVESGKDHDVVLVIGAGAEGIETGRVSGRLRVNGAPVQGWHLRTWGKLRRSATSAADGSFELGLLAAGDVTIMISPPGRNFMNGASSYTHVLTLNAGDERWVDIAFDAGMVTGTVVDDRTGLPVRGATVSARSVENEGGNWFGGRYGTSASDENGYYEIADLAAGRYRVHTDADGYTKATSDELDVGPGRTPFVEMRLSAGWVVSGRVVTQGVDGEDPPRWMWLTAETPDGREAAARPDDDLEFRFDDLGPGEWEFRLLSSYDVEFEPVTVRLDYPEEDLQLVFAPQPPPPPIDPAVKAELQELGYISSDG